MAVCDRGAMIIYNYGDLFTLALTDCEALGAIHLRGATKYP